MGERLAGGNVAVALLANTLATVFALYVLIEVLWPGQRGALQPARDACSGLKSRSPSPAWDGRE